MTYGVDGILERCFRLLGCGRAEYTIHGDRERRMVCGKGYGCTATGTLDRVGFILHVCESHLGLVALEWLLVDYFHHHARL